MTYDINAVFCCVAAQGGAAVRGLQGKPQAHWWQTVCSAHNNILTTVSAALLRRVVLPFEGCDVLQQFTPQPAMLAVHLLEVMQPKVSP
jgi:hypothetical protein